MSIDGFLQFLGLVVAVYALFSVVVRYRFRLHGWLLWFPTAGTLMSVVYLLLFDLVGLSCGNSWCTALQLSEREGLTPSKLAFLVVLAWLLFVLALLQRKLISGRQLPLLAGLIDRLVAEKRYPELVEFIGPQIDLISRCASRRLPLQRLRDRVRWQGSPFFPPQPPVTTAPTKWQVIKAKLQQWCYIWLKPVLAQLPESGRKEEAAQRILRVLHTNEQLVEFIALERPLFALQLMDTGTRDHDFSDRAFDLMMAHPESQLRRETLLNDNLDRCFFVIDPKNPLINALFADANLAEKLEVWRPVGNFPIRLLERNIDNYRQTISASKPWEDQILHRDPTYAMIRFFDVMVRSAMRDGLSSHMWLLYFDILVDKLVRFMDRTHPDYDLDREFPNFGYYLIYEVFHIYGEWLRAIECCPEKSPAIQIENTSPNATGPGVVKWTMVSMARSLRHLINSPTEDEFVSYVIEIIMRDYKNLAGVPNGAHFQEALRNHLIAADQDCQNANYGARFRRCYDQIDHCMKYDTRDFEAALIAAYP
ncbi:MAG: hypothetical protein LH610_12710 [Sphingomonas bacterium]|nr:hypothetical protein [Sphingomonas bacterium]